MNTITYANPYSFFPYGLQLYVPKTQKVNDVTVKKSPSHHFFLINVLCSQILYRENF